MGLRQVTPTVLFMDDALSDLATGTYTVTRQLKPTISNGRSVPDPAPQTLSIQGVMQPASKVDMMRVPEGRRTADVRGFYAPVQLRIQSDTDASDLVTVGDDLFEVSDVEAFGSGMDSNYWRATLLRTTRLNAGQP